MLRHYKRGIALMLAVSVGLLVVIVKVARLAFIILERIESQGRGVDVGGILEAAHQAFTASDSLIYGFVSLWITFCWIMGVVDAYRMGKKKDLEQLARQVTNSRAG